jgi:hypothetical protein
VKNFVVLFTVALYVALPTLAQEFELSGEVKTGMYWQSVQEGDQEAESRGYVHNNDDAGGNQGRFRLNFHYRRDTIGVKLRFQETTWDNTQIRWPDAFPYAFAYGDFLNEQIKISSGKLGDSPWGMGGPEKWDELDTRIGIRTEIKPYFVSGLNVGFVLNDWNLGGVVPKDQTLGEVLQESVVGASYDHDYFAFRFAYRFDSTKDQYNASNEGAELIYRVEERALKKLVEGLQIWANGHYIGIDPEDETLFATTNWLYAQYEPEAFTAQIRLGYDTGWNRQILHVRPSFYYNVFSFLSAGASFYYAQDYGTKYSEGSAFYAWNVEPKVRLTLGGTYVEMVYHYGSEYLRQDVEEKIHWINLRLVYTF